jgi:hypothetical protein
MNRHSYRALAASLGLSLTGSAGAGIVTLDFEDAVDGESVTDRYEGLTFGLIGAAEGPKAHTLTRKKLLNKYGNAGGTTIRPSNSDQGTFKGPWFDIEIGFETATDYFSIFALDADEPVSAYAYLGTELVDSVSFRGGRNFQVWHIELGGLGGPVFDRVVLDIRDKGNGMKPGPEIFDNLSYNALGVESVRGAPGIPAPGAAPLLAMGGLLGARRRRRTG